MSEREVCFLIGESFDCRGVLVRTSVGLGSDAGQDELGQLERACVADVLERVLKRLNVRSRDTTVLGLSHGDDAAVTRALPNTWQAHTVDFFKEVINDLHLFGQIAACHALGDLHAMGATPSHALAIATLPPSSSRER